jgi:zona occludens toxin
MITVITGPTGSGKTALAVAMMLEYKRGSVWNFGVTDLSEKVPHQTAPPVAEWTERRPHPQDPKLMQPHYTFPPRSLVVIDEAQNVFRPRASGAAVPDVVAAYETHRHEAIHFILLTQHPGLLDANVRKLCKQHIHLFEVPLLGTYKLEYNKIFDPEVKADRELCARSKYKPPRHVFGLYKSAEEHGGEIRKAIPKHYYIFAACVLALSGSGWWFYDRMHSRLSPQTSQAGTGVVQGQSQQGAGQGAARGPKTAAQWVQDQQPRVAGLAYSAPVFDEVIKPTDAPYPAACVVSESQGCRCYSQQATRLDVPKDMCNQIVARGFFVAWKGKDKSDVPGGAASRDGAAGTAGRESWSWKPGPDSQASGDRGGAIGWHEAPSLKDSKG